MQKPKLILDARAELGEGPVWDERLAVLWWVDISGKALHRFDPATGKDLARGFDDMVAAVGLTQQENVVVVALACDLVLYDFEAGKVLKRYGDPEPNEGRTRLNDGKPGPGGRFWVGTLHMRSSDRPMGALYSVDVGGTATAHVQDVTTSNGMGWSKDLGTFYYIDSSPRTVDAFDFDPERGLLSNRRRVTTFTERDATPDGMCVDAEGMLWIAHWDGWCVSRWNPTTGERLQTIDVPVAKVTACTFGGPDLATLYITTARQGTDAATAERQPHAGGVFAIEPGVRGLPAFRFAGS